MKKVLLITNIPNPYRIPLFNEMSRQLEREGLSLTVVFGALGYKQRKWKIDMENCDFDYRVLNSPYFNVRNNESVSFIYPGLNAVIRELEPAVIITNAFSIATLKLWLRSFLVPTNYIIWSGGIYCRIRPVSFLRRWQRKLLTRRASGFVAYGTMAKEYLVDLGADPDKVYIGINTVDTAYFSAARDSAGGEQAESAGGPPLLLYVGHLNPGKRVDLLLRVLQHVKEQGQDFRLRIIGDGPERGSLQAMAQELGLDSNVEFMGFLQREQVRENLALARCLVFPSEYDIWGLVVVEAMAASVPVISSIYSGVTRDLVLDGQTGFAVDYEDTETTAGRLIQVLENPEFAREMGVAAATFIKENVSVQKSASGFVEAYKNSLQA